MSIVRGATATSSPVTRVPLSALAESLTAGTAHESSPALGGPPFLVVSDDGATDDELAAAAQAARSLPCVLAAHASGARLAALVDVLADDDDIALLATTVGVAPIASVTFALLLRGHDDRANGASAIDDGLIAESTTYSMLQGGPEFGAWLAARRQRQRERLTANAVPVDGDDAVLVARDGNVLTVTLNRPSRHNALNVDVRDGLASALSIALADTSITRVVMRGNGPSFCSGGDLDSFGTFADPASAHLVRLTRSPARLVAALAPLIEVHLHGACLGAGIELPAFAHRVIANETTSIGLPEVALGLVPGAGGTVSLPNRIGRHRTALLALTGQRLDAATAHRWGLVDEITG